MVMSDSLHVGQDGSSTEEGSCSDSAGGHGCSVFRGAAASLRVTSGVVAGCTSVLGEAFSNGVGGLGQARVARSRGRNVGGVWCFATRRSAGVYVRRGVIGLGTIGRGVVTRGKDTVENVQDTVREQDVGSDDTSAVDEDFALNDGDGDVVATESGDRAVGQRAAVRDGAVDHVVLQDLGGFFSSEVGQSRRNVLESSVDGSKDGEVRRRVDSFSQVRCIDGTEERAKSSLLSNSADIRRYSKKAVNYMNDSTIKGNVLGSV